MRGKFVTRGGGATGKPRSLMDAASGRLPTSPVSLSPAMRSPTCLLESRVYGSKKDFCNMGYNTPTRVAAGTSSRRTPNCFAASSEGKK
jgi:hypothetical protein